MLVTTNCENCSKEFQFEKPKPSSLDKRACSKECSYKLRIKTRLTDHPPLEKTCIDCKETFQDTSKKKLVTRCQLCVNSNMVKTRKESGSYVRSDAQNEKLSESLRKKYESGWNPNTEEHREKLSQQMKSRWSDGTMAEKTKETSLRKYGVDHWTKSEEGKKNSSNLHKGRKHPESIRKKMSMSAANRVRNKRESLYTSAKGGKREDLGGMYFRSCWEANFARILNHLEKEWQYEPKSFVFENGSTYTPDFFCEGKFYELKGRMTESCKEKIKCMKEQYPDVSIEIIDGVKYKELKVQYKNLLPFWEGK
jgi:DNA-directed RNA polymerase subunit RPC12/RpoP